MSEDLLEIGGREFRSRLLLGTGKFGSPELMKEALVASGTEIVTVALRRADVTGGNDPFANILDFIDPENYLLLANTSGAMNADEAVRLARLAEAAGLPKWIKLEIHPDPTYLLPDPIETLKAAEVLVTEGFTVLIEQANVPVIVDAGIGAPSHAAEASEMGAAAVLVNTAIAVAGDPPAMALAFKDAVDAGRRAFNAGLPMQSEKAEATSPLTGFLGN